MGFYPCRDLARTRRFYRALGLTLARDQGTCLIFRVAPGGYVGFCQHDAALPEHPGLILTLVLDDVDGTYARLCERGVPTEAPPRENARFGIYHFFARDPDGYRLEVQRFLEPL
nr:VOC family protein [Truepera radiovictrix]